MAFLNIGNGISAKKKNYDPVKVSEYNAKYYQEHKRDKWGYKGVYGHGLKNDPYRSVSGRALPTVSSINRSTIATSPSTINQLKKVDNTPASSANNQAKSVSSLISKATTWTSKQLKEHKEELKQALELVRQNKNKVSDANQSGNTIAVTSKTNPSETADLHDTANNILSQGPMAAQKEEKKKQSTGSKSTGSGRSSSGSGKTSAGNKASSGSGKTSAGNKASSGTTNKSSGKKAEAEEKRKTSQADRTNTKNKKAKSMDKISYEGLNSKGRSAAKKRKAELEKKKAEELAKLNEQYKQQVDALSASYTPGQGSESLTVQVQQLSDKLAKDKSAIEKSYASKLAGIVAKFLKNPRYIGKDSGSGNKNKTNKPSDKIEKISTRSKTSSVKKSPY